MKRKYHAVGAVCLVALCVTQTGCTVLTGEDWGPDRGRGLISTDEKGMQALSDMVAGLQTNAKASADVPDTPYYDLRRRQAVARYVVKQPTKAGR